MINDSGQRQLTSLLPPTSALGGVSWTSQQDTPPLGMAPLFRATRMAQHEPGGRTAELAM
jgi:hypothetical protein